MELQDTLNDDIYYIIEIEIDNEKRYLYTKNVALHFCDMGKKFLYKWSAQRYYKGSVFDDMNCKHRIILYSRYKDMILE